MAQHRRNQRQNPTVRRHHQPIGNGRPVAPAVFAVHARSAGADAAGQAAMATANPPHVPVGKRAFARDYARIAGEAGILPANHQPAQPNRGNRQYALHPMAARFPDFIADDGAGQRRHYRAAVVALGAAPAAKPAKRRAGGARRSFRHANPIGGLRRICFGGQRL